MSTQPRPPLGRMIAIFWIVFFAAWPAAAPAEGLGNPFFALCMDTHDSQKRTLPQQAELLKSLGYDGCGHLWLDGVSERLQTLDAAGLKLFQIYLRVNIAEGQTPYDARLKEILPELKGRDVMLALLINGGKPSDPTGDTRAAEIVREIAALAAPFGVRVALYPHSGQWLERTEDALRLAEKVNHPYVGVMFNLSHFLKVDDEKNMETLLTKARPRLFAVTLNGSDRAAEIHAGKGKWIAPLDEGAFEMAGLLRTLVDLGYTGPIGLQCYGIAGDAREHLARSATAWRKLSAQALADEAGFKPMFNGKDLTGWAGDTTWWGAKNGCITAESTPEKPCKKQSYLMWRGGEPGDFDLRLTLRLVGGNSGIQLRSREIPNWDTRGYQADMDDACVWAGALFEHMRAGIAMRGQKVFIAPDGKKTILKLGDSDELKKRIRVRDWNDYRVVCRGNEITLFLNGVMMSQATDNQEGIAARRGIIALQNHPGPPMKVEFKNLRIKELK